MYIIMSALRGSILLLAFLKLDAETSGKDSIGYKRFKRIGGICLSGTWGSITVLAIMLLILNNL